MLNDKNLCWQKLSRSGHRVTAASRITDTPSWITGWALPSEYVFEPDLAVLHKQHCALYAEYKAFQLLNFNEFRQILGKIPNSFLHLETSSI